MVNNKKDINTYRHLSAKGKKWSIKHFRVECEILSFKTGNNQLRLNSPTSST
jgi:hypothetical protein